MASVFFVAALRSLLPDTPRGVYSTLEKATAAAQQWSQQMLPDVFTIAEVPLDPPDDQNEILNRWYVALGTVQKDDEEVSVEINHASS